MNKKFIFGLLLLFFSYTYSIDKFSDNEESYQVIEVAVPVDNDIVVNSKILFDKTEIFCYITISIYVISISALALWGVKKTST